MKNFIIILFLTPFLISCADITTNFNFEDDSNDSRKTYEESGYKRSKLYSKKIINKRREHEIRRQMMGNC